MIGPSLSKLRRDWREGGAALLPPGMIARAVVWRMLARMEPGDSVRLVREERGFRVVRSVTGYQLDDQTDEGDQ